MQLKKEDVEAIEKEIRMQMQILSSNNKRREYLLLGHYEYMVLSWANFINARRDVKEWIPYYKDCIEVLHVDRVNFIRVI